MNFDNVLNVLIVENNEVDSKMLVGMLAKSPQGSFNNDCVFELNQAFDKIKSGSYDVVLLDLNLVDSNGIDTLVRMHKEFPSLPIVVNTGAYEDNLGLRAVTLGAQDYLIKGKYLPYGLARALYYAVERKNAEIELQNAYHRLKETQQQLIQVEKMNIIGSVASGVAHEVKNPLATVLYGVEYLQTQLNGQGTEKILMAINSIRDAAQRADRIIKDLLDFSSLTKFEKVPIDIHYSVNNALKLVNHQFERNCIKIEKQFCKNMPEVLVDKNRIEQAIVDILLNAAQAMRVNGVLTVRTSHKELTSQDLEAMEERQPKLALGTKVAVIEIEDSGPGIQEDHKEKIFDPFFTTRRGAGGVGLGLSIARTIVHNHDGHIYLDNVKGGGVCARFILPV